MASSFAALSDMNGYKSGKVFFVIAERDYAINNLLYSCIGKWYTLNIDTG